MLRSLILLHKKDQWAGLLNGFISRDGSSFLRLLWRQQERTFLKLKANIRIIEKNGGTRKDHSG